MAKWILLRKYADFQAIAKDCGVSVYLACLMRNRGVMDSAQAKRYLFGSMKDLYDPSLLHDLDKAVHILQQKIRDGRKIRIIGDYDADGVCSSYILFPRFRFFARTATSVCRKESATDTGSTNGLFRKPQRTALTRSLPVITVSRQPRRCAQRRKQALRLL